MFLTKEFQFCYFTMEFYVKSIFLILVGFVGEKEKCSAENDREDCCNSS